MQYEHELVQQVIKTYQQHGLKAVAATRWNLGGEHWEQNKNSALHMLKQWCFDHDNHELMDEFQQYMHRTQCVAQQTQHVLKSENPDFSHLEHLNNLREDVVCAEVFCAGVTHQREEWMQWACKNVGEQWSNCFALVLLMMAHRKNISGFELVLGGWCEQCNSTQCSSHVPRAFLNEQHQDLMGQALEHITRPAPPFALHVLNQEIHNLIDVLRHHFAWDNTNTYVQSCAKRMLLHAARLGDTKTLNILLGPNDHAVSDDEHKKRVCINRKDITYALIQQCQDKKIMAKITPIFAGRVDGERLRENPYLHDFLEHHEMVLQQILHHKLTTVTGKLTPSKTPRKM